MKIFNEQHEMFRGTVRSFVEKEIAPHIEEWEAAGRMPRWIWPRMGELGLLGVEYDEKYGGAGADVLTSAVRGSPSVKTTTCGRLKRAIFDPTKSVTAWAVWAPAARTSTTALTASPQRASGMP